MFDWLVGFGFLYGLAMLVENQKIKFYVAGVVFAAAWAVWQLLVPLLSGNFSVLLGPGVYGSIAVDAVLATILFWVLDRYSDTIAWWIIIFTIGWFGLIMW